MRITEAYGPHLVFDGYGCNPETLGSVGQVYAFLDRAPAEIGMTKITPPYVFEYRPAEGADWGVSGFVLIAESHISVHTYPAKSYLSLDMFSCKDFDQAQAEALIKTHFEVQTWESRLLTRGLEFPRDARLVTRHLLRERSKA